MLNIKQRMKQFSEVDIYPVISSEFCMGKKPENVLKQIADGGARIVQLREKNMPKPEMAKLAEKYRKITSEYEMLFIMNDHVDIALECDADGVHLGQDDTPLIEGRKSAPDLILGVSTHSIEEALEAVENEASYINIGPIYATGTKSLSMQPLGLEGITEISPLINIPFTVMGGIKAKHIPGLLKAGASKIAMVTEITQAKNITERVCELRRLFNT